MNWWRSVVVFSCCYCCYWICSEGTVCSMHMLCVSWRLMPQWRKIQIDIMYYSSRRRQSWTTLKALLLYKIATYEMSASPHDFTLILLCAPNWYVDIRYLSSIPWFSRWQRYCVQWHSSALSPSDVTQLSSSLIIILFFYLGCYWSACSWGLLVWLVLLALLACFIMLL